MQRPPSIRLFEQLYLGSLLLWAINTALFWSQARELMLQSAQAQANPQVAAVMPAIMLGSAVVTAVVALLFWYLVARQASAVGKWLVVGTEAIGALVALLALVRLVTGRVPNVPSVAIGLVVTALAVAAAVVLFRPDARMWLGEGESEDDDLAPPVEPLA